MSAAAEFETCSTRWVDCWLPVCQIKPESGLCTEHRIAQEAMMEALEAAVDATTAAQVVISAAARAATTLARARALGVPEDVIEAAARRSGSHLAFCERCYQPADEPPLCDTCREADAAAAAGRSTYSIERRRAADAERKREQRALRKAEGLCADCDKPALRGETRCAKHQRLNAERAARARERRRDAS